MCVESAVSNIAGQPSEPLHVELTDEVLTYLRGVMLQQMSEQVKLRSHPRASHVEHVDLSDVPGVSWSSARTRYRAVHIDGKGAQTTHYTKNLDEAIKFTKDGIKNKKKQIGEIDGDDDAPAEHDANDGDNTHSDVDGQNEEDDDRKCDNDDQSSN